MTTRKYKLAIIEDSDEDLKLLTDNLDRYKEEYKTDFAILSYKNINSFLEAYSMQFDILFIDIDLGTTSNGLDLAREIRKKDEDVVIIFVTNLSKFALKGYEVDALDYMLKPIRYTSFVSRIQKALRVIDSRPTENILVNVFSGMRKIPLNSLLYVEVIGHSIKCHLINEVVEGKGTLKEIEKKIDNKSFSRCNYCYFVNLRYVEGVEKYECLINGERLQISHPRKKKFTDDLMAYLLNK